MPQFADDFYGQQKFRRQFCRTRRPSDSVENYKQSIASAIGDDWRHSFKSIAKFGNLAK